MMKLCTILPLLQMPLHLEPLTIVIVLLVGATFLAVFISNRFILQRIHVSAKEMLSTRSIMQRAFKISANNVVEYVIQHSYIYRLSGHLLPEAGMSVNEWKAHLHPDDREQTLYQFRRMMNGEVKEAEFYYRWNMDYSGGRSRWGYMHNRSIAEFTPGMNRPVSIISTLIDETELQRQQTEEQELSERYRQIFENSIIGLSFYSPDGWLLNSNEIMRHICNFDNEESDAFFSNNNLFDVMPFNEVCDRHNVEELWMCSLSVVPERNMHTYLEIRLRPIYDDKGELMYISVATRDVSEERKLYLNAIQTDIELQKVNASIQLYETELRYMMEACEMQAWRISLDRNVIEFYNGLSTVDRSFTLQQLPRIFVDQDDPFVQSLSDPVVAFSRPLYYVGKMHPVLSGKNTEPQWVQVNAIPEYDDQGRLIGSFGVLRNIMKMMQKQEQLRRETERAKESGHMKSVFLANMTHEIRTPLNAIVGFSDLLQAVGSPDDKKEMIRVIHNNCDMLLRLINDILILSNVDANAMSIQVSDIDLAVEFDIFCQSLAQRVQEPGVEFIKDNPYARIHTRIDKERLFQVMTNFVTNAVKYTHQGHIRVGYRFEERNGKQGFYSYCEDTGVGIPADQQERIFQRFVKLNDYVQGTGLGLSICKAIIEMYGGEIGVVSEEGKGSTFWYWIPAEISWESVERIIPS